MPNVPEENSFTEFSYFIFLCFSAKLQTIYILTNVCWQHLDLISNETVRGEWVWRVCVLHCGLGGKVTCTEIFAFRIIYFDCIFTWHVRISRALHTCKRLILDTWSKAAFDYVLLFYEMYALYIFPEIYSSSPLCCLFRTQTPRTMCTRLELKRSIFF